MRYIRRLAGLAAATAALLAAGCSGTAAAPRAAAPAPAALARQVKAALSTATSVHITGTVMEQGQRVQLDLSLIRTGDLSGSFAVGSEPITVLATEGEVYVKLTASSLRAMNMPASSCARYCGRYLRLPAGNARSFTGDLSWPRLLGTDPLPGSEWPDARVSGPVTVGGQATWLVRGSNGAAASVAAHGPAFPLRITPARGQGSGRIDLTEWNSVTIPPPPPASQIVTPGQLGA